MHHTRLSVVCPPEFAEILMAELSQANFDTFLETDNGFEAYVEGDNFDRQAADAVRAKYGHVAPLDFTFSRIEKKNWNEEWEKSYSPVVVEDQCLIRASFHKPERTYPYEVIITPKMSFGTGHHQTTYLMVKSMLQMDFKDKRVMDAGCGTAILSVVASMLGAREVEAFDIDEWSVENGNENLVVNGRDNVRIQRGTINEVELSGLFDVILANINRNVLMEELHRYKTFLAPAGFVLLSGFLEADIPALLAESSRHELREVRRDTRDSWASLLLQS